MSSLTYHVLLGLLGLLVAGSLYSIMDQINMGNLFDLAVRQNLNGDYINVFVWFWALIPIALTLSALIGWYAQAHFARNDY
jgi:hypothetical protein